MCEINCNLFHFQRNLKCKTSRCLSYKYKLVFCKRFSFLCSWYIGVYWFPCRWIFPINICNLWSTSFRVTLEEVDGKGRSSLGVSPPSCSLIQEFKSSPIIILFLTCLFKVDVKKLLTKSSFSRFMFFLFHHQEFLC